MIKRLKLNTEIMSYQNIFAVTILLVIPKTTRLLTILLFHFFQNQKTLFNKLDICGLGLFDPLDESLNNHSVFWEAHCIMAKQWALKPIVTGWDPSITTYKLCNPGQAVHCDSSPFFCKMGKTTISTSWSCSRYLQYYYVKGRLRQ